MSDPKVPAESERTQKILIAILAALMCIAVVLLVYGMSEGIDSVAVLGFCIAMPVFFALIVNVGMLFAWSKQK